MRVINKLKREKEIRKLAKVGYNRMTASQWLRMIKKDRKKCSNQQAIDQIDAIHDSGFLSTRFDTYRVSQETKRDFITDLEYLYIHPINTAFSKWTREILTLEKIVRDSKKHCLKSYFSIVDRDFNKLIFKTGSETPKCSLQDVQSLLKEKRALAMIPYIWKSTKPRYMLESCDKDIIINGQASDFSELERIVTNLEQNYLVTEMIDVSHSDEKLPRNAILKFYVANDGANKSHVLDAYLVSGEILEGIEGENYRYHRRPEIAQVDVNSGEYNIGSLDKIEDWEDIIRDIEKLASELFLVDYMTIYTTVGKEFKILMLDGEPNLPSMPISDNLNNFLRAKLEVRKEKGTPLREIERNAREYHRLCSFTEKHGRPGIRPYMQRLWNDSVKEDFFETKTSLASKLWAWKRGFLSYRIDQYGLTNENYRGFLSDYDYHWLNRINNAYQNWINDKTTFRYTMEEFFSLIPEYYFILFNRDYQKVVARMVDCPAEYTADYDGIFALLRSKGKLAFKASSGTHGDGFYCLEYREKKYYVNDEEKEEDEIIEFMKGLKTSYLVTDFIVLNADLKKIYDKSVNTVRVMVINEHGYDPKIMQTYMRIGSSKSGYTDNVAYGGVCVMINRETGEMYNPEQLIDHKYISCEKHPDTGSEIKGIVPNWEYMCDNLLKVCRSLPELEYLGFDIAITDTGFQIIEINIHQDLHKVGSFDAEIKDYFSRKMRNKHRKIVLEQEKLADKLRSTL